MFKKTIILSMLLFLTGCSVSNDTLESNENKNFQPILAQEDKAEIFVDSSYINPREAIKNYLLSQKDFVWKTEKYSKNFCTFNPFNPINEKEIYIWARCSEFGFKDGSLLELSGVSVPVKLASLEGNKFSHQIPRDGVLYSADLKQIFPKDIRDKMISEKDIILVNANSNLLEQAKRYFEVDDFSQIPNSFIQHCELNSDCITPFNYMIRSDCPYSSKCINNKCEVVCEY